MGTTGRGRGLSWFCSTSLTRNMLSVYSGSDSVWKQAPYSQTLGSFIAAATLCQDTLSSATASLSASRRAKTSSFSSGVTKVAFDGQSITYHQAAKARAMVSRPSIMKIHLGGGQLIEGCV